jgi:hypothetical protein
MRGVKPRHKGICKEGAALPGGVRSVDRFRTVPISNDSARVLPAVCLLVHVCFGGVSRFDRNIAAPAVGPRGSLGYSRLSVSVVFRECAEWLVRLGAVSRVTTAP